MEIADPYLSLFDRSNPMEIAQPHNQARISQDILKPRLGSLELGVEKDLVDSGYGPNRFRQTHNSEYSMARVQ
jgi:hypothetical protein